MDESVANDSMALWAQFAKTGSPATMDIAWPAYTNEREEFSVDGLRHELAPGVTQLFAVINQTGGGAMPAPLPCWLRRDPVWRRVLSFLVSPIVTIRASITPRIARTTPLTRRRCHLDILRVTMTDEILHAHLIFGFQKDVIGRANIFRRG
ncbi:hypothetical protein UMZ34_13575 [Halopseudomonas pachastrellae]|nr:hypothetical protein UMZ34_13575 [Halopseudomonas pachastrellae]